MNDAPFDDRLRGVLDALARGPVPAAAAPAALVQRARRRQQRRDLAKAVVVAVLVLALVGALAARRQSRINHRPDVLERRAAAAHAVVPTWLPDGLEFQSATFGGSEQPVYDDDAFHLLFTDPNDVLRQMSVIIRARGSGQPLPVADHLPSLTIAGTAASVFPEPGNAYDIFAALGDRQVQIHGVHLPLATAVRLGDSLSVVDGRVAYTVPDGLRVDYDGRFLASSPSATLSWGNASGGRSLLVDTAFGTPPGMLATLANLTDPDVVQRGSGAIALLSDGGNGHLDAAWLDADHVPHTLSSEGLDREEVVRILGSMVPLDAAQLARLRRLAGDDAFTISPWEDAAGGPSSSAMAASTTAPGVPPTAGGPVDMGSADSVRPGGVAAGTVKSDRISNGVVVRLDVDHWIGVQTGRAPGSNCGGVTAVMDGERLVRWQAPCNPDVRFAPDGSCLDAKCSAGLWTFDVAVENGRIIAHPETWRWGQPGPGLTGG